MSGHGHGHGPEHEGDHSDPRNKRVALVIAVIALFLAFSETMGKGAQTNALSLNIEASNLWAFFQAKTIRMTAVRTAAEAMEVEAAASTDAARKEAQARRIDSWKKVADRYDNEPETNEGRRQLASRAKQAEEKRDTAMARYHHYEVASAAFQIAIVLCSAAIITSMMVLTYVAGGLTLVGLAFMGVGLLAPHAVHLL